MRAACILMVSEIESREHLEIKQDIFAPNTLQSRTLAIHEPMDIEDCYVVVPHDSFDGDDGLNVVGPMYEVRIPGPPPNLINQGIMARHPVGHGHIWEDLTSDSLISRLLQMSNIENVFISDCWSRMGIAYRQDLDMHAEFVSNGSFITVVEAEDGRPLGYWVDIVGLRAAYPNIEIIPNLVLNVQELPAQEKQLGQIMDIVDEWKPLRTRVAYEDFWS